MIFYQNIIMHILRDLSMSKRIIVVMDKVRRTFINNYGELPQFINEADGDPWDVIVPGYPKLPPSVPYDLKEIVGVYRLPDGNDKLIVDIYTDSLKNPNRVKTEVNKFVRMYEDHTGLKGQVEYF